MPPYFFTLEDSKRIADPDATEDLADNQAAMGRAELIAKDLERSKAALNKLRVVVRNEAGDEIGRVPLRADLRFIGGQKSSDRSHFRPQRRAR
jgi:hypothetical protein